MAYRQKMSAAAAGPEPQPPDPGGQDLAEQRLARAIRDLGSAQQPAVRPAPYDAIRLGSGLSIARCLELFDAQLGEQAPGPGGTLAACPRQAGYYTIGSSGHEGNAAVAAALRLTDPALLHYRSGAFYLARAAQASPPRDGVTDILLGLVAAAAEPIAGGRHKVFGHPELHVIPQTSTIASHLPRAVGLAFSMARAAKLGLQTPLAGRQRRSSPASATRRPTTPRAAGALNTAVLRRLPGPAAAAAVRLRGQRPRHQRQDPRRLDRVRSSRRPA